MSNLPETATYDAGVYQIETTDAVVGGVSGKSNASAINLANRTAYLKAHVDAMEVIVAQADAEAGTATALKGWTAQRVRQAIAAAITALVVQATETVKGIAEIATQSETNAGSDDARIVTPLKLRYGFAISLATDGYIALPSWLSGLIIQWGNPYDSTHTNATQSFNIAFPTACLFRMIVNSDEGNTSPSTPCVITIYDVFSTTSFKWTCNISNTAVAAIPNRFSWLAIGY